MPRTMTLKLPAGDTRRVFRYLGQPYSRLGWLSTIPDFPGYLVSSKGRVYDERTGEEVRQGKCGNGGNYRGVTLKRDGERRGVRLLVHRLVAQAFILNKEGKPYVDHIDGDKLNNNRRNLRWATTHENGRNAKMRSDNTSGYKGVSYHKSNGKWRSRINDCGKNRHLGYFDTAEEAAAAYRAAAICLHGEFARFE